MGKSETFQKSSKDLLKSSLDGFESGKGGGGG